MSKSQRDKGQRFEQAVVRFFKRLGHEAFRVPMSGGAAGFPGDVRVKIIPGGEMLGLDSLAGASDKIQIECKWRGDGFTQIYRWLRGNDMLIIKADRKPALAVFELPQGELIE